jgi:YVTN family beta-propeller protein
MAYVTHSNDNLTSVIDGVTNTVITTIQVGSGPTAVAVNPQTNKVFVANFNDDTVSVIH